MTPNLTASQEKIVSMIKAGSAADTQDFLVRSKRDVLRLLNEMLVQDKPVSISLLNADCVVQSSLIYVDADSDTLLLACPPEWAEPLRAAADSIMISCILEHSKIEFQGGAYAIVDLEGAPVVGLPIPEFMWRFQRRSDRRHKVSGLQIVLNMGFLEAEAEVVDLSMSGIGLLNCNREIKLDNGEILPNCSIALPGVGQISVNLAVQHQVEVRLEDGRTVTRVGCKLTGIEDRTRQMITHFLDALVEK